MELARFGPNAAYQTRLLKPSDLRDLQTLLERAADYFLITTGSAPASDEAERAFVGGPPTKSVEDKRTIGVFTTDNEMVGVLDAIVGWPKEGEWSMGMLLLDPAHRGAGLGSAVLDAYEEWATREGARRFQTAVVSQHGPGIGFLERAGYRRTSVLEDSSGGGRSAAIVFFEKVAGMQSARDDGDRPLRAAE